MPFAHSITTSFLICLIAFYLAVVWNRKPPEPGWQEERTLPATCTSNTTTQLRLTGSLLSSDRTHEADTTAVVMNYSRFHNVVRIASLLCSTSLEGVVRNVFIWNNNPNQTLSYSDFPGCPKSKIKVHNSPQNLYFQARFMACSEANTAFCFFQDDDYLIRPEIVASLVARIMEDPSTSVYLSPPVEALSSLLRTVTRDSLHTSFAWLGYGSIVPRQHAIEFLSLLRSLNGSEETMKMADNYFSVLRNDFPQVWLDQPYELGGGQPFTVGTEGESRNRRHILRAAGILDSLLAGHGNLPFTRTESGAGLEPEMHAPAVSNGVPCLLRSSFPLIPNKIKFMADSATAMLKLESQRLESIPREYTDAFLTSPLSHAVDGYPETFAKSPIAAALHDYLELRLWGSVLLTRLEIVMLVDEETTKILDRTVVRTRGNDDNTAWAVHHRKWDCNPVDPGAHLLHECGMELEAEELGPDTRYFQVYVKQVPLGSHYWVIHELWLRGAAVV